MKITILNKIKDRIATRKAGYGVISLAKVSFRDAWRIGQFAATTATAIDKFTSATAKSDEKLIRMLEYGV
jgi:hypothetical protein